MSHVRSLGIMAVLALFVVQAPSNAAPPATTHAVNVGVRLVYQVHVPEDAPAEVLDETVKSLQRRTNPGSHPNVKFRAIPPDQIEAVFLAPSAATHALIAQWTEAHRRLDATNLHWPDVEKAMAIADVDQRKTKLAELAGDCAERTEALKELPPLFDEMQKLEEQERRVVAQDPAKARELADHRERILMTEVSPWRTAIDRTNIDPGWLEDMLARTPEEPKRSQRLDRLKQLPGGSPVQSAAIDEFVRCYDACEPVRGMITDVDVLKRLMTGSGELEFHIMVKDMNAPAAQAMVKRLDAGGKGPAVKAGDEMQWFEVERPSEFGGRTLKYGAKAYALAWITPAESMGHGKGQPAWGLKRAYKVTNSVGQDVVGFEFDANGAKLFGELTGTHINQPLAAVLDGRIIAAPTIRSRIEASGIIEGGRNGYKASEVDYLINTLNAGALPARLDEQPVSEELIRGEAPSATKP